MNDIFTRAFWDLVVKLRDSEAFSASYRGAPVARGAEGYSQREFALRSASRIVSDILSNRFADEGLREGFQWFIREDGRVAAEQAALGTPQKEALSLRGVARLLGVDLVGITEIDERWHYTLRADVRSMAPCRTTCRRA